MYKCTKIFSGDSCVNVEQKTNIFETGYVPIVMVNVGSDHKLHLYIV
jgi:hypothetical protein